MNDERYMRRAIEIAESNPRHPFGAVIVDRIHQQVVAEGVNRASESPLWHAEIVAIQNAVEKSADWSETILYSTAEPCPMCMAAILWAGIGRVVYGTSISTLQALGWNQIRMSAQSVISASHRPQTLLSQGSVHEDCDQLFVRAAQFRS